MKAYTKDFLTKLKKQDSAAFGELYDNFVDIFYRYIKSHYKLSEADMQDILSDIFVKIRNALPRLDDSSSASLSWFIWTIAKNHIIDFFKRTREVSFGTLASYSQDKEKETRREQWLEDPEDFMNTFNISFTHEKIQEAILLLDDIYKDPILLRFVEELSYEEIAHILQTTQETIRQRISRWLKKLNSLISLIE